MSTTSRISTWPSTRLPKYGFFKECPNSHVLCLALLNQLLGITAQEPCSIRKVQKGALWLPNFSKINMICFCRQKNKNQTKLTFFYWPPNPSPNPSHPSQVTLGDVQDRALYPTWAPSMSCPSHVKLAPQKQKHQCKHSKAEHQAGCQEAPLESAVSYLVIRLRNVG